MKLHSTSSPGFLPGVSNRHLRETVRLSVPVVIGQLGIVLTGVIDNMMVGWISYEHLSASSLANSIFMILAIISMGMTYAISPLVAEAHAVHKPWKYAAFLRQGTLVGIIASLITMALMEGAIHLMPLLDQPEDDIVLGTSYLRWLYWSMLPMILFMTYKQYTDGLSRTRIAMIVTLVGLMANAVGNWAFIFGNWGMPRLELDGAGVATLMSRVIMFAVLAWYIHVGGEKNGVKLAPGSWKPSWSIIRKILAIGIPSGLQLFFEVGAFAGAVIIIGWIGQAPRSAHQIVLNLSSVTYMVVTGIAAGATIRVGNAKGRKDLAEVREAGYAGLWLGGLFMTVSAGVFLLGRHVLPTMYNSHPEVLEIASGLMVLAGLFQIFDGLQAVGLGILRGLQDVMIPMLIAFGCYWLVALPLGYVTSIVLEWGVKGVWVGFVLSLGMAAAAFMWRFRKLTREGAVAGQ